MVSMSTGSAQYMIVVYASICAVTRLQVLRLICLLSTGLSHFHHSGANLTIAHLLNFKFLAST